ncbi:hypothetical protein NliqN6_6625 [Naganishia liquefaciens]|uniref:Uncharacterized protein n=1 Tax=Naganishia liquefaciens TaxID=104408 RepID=A0A8H3U005_9TREE|nr:hypothetical protein NliqN6_6625 [Naganishia liquefaciens]
MLIQKTTMKVPEEGEASLPNDLSMKYAFLFIQDPRITKEIATGEDLLKSYVLLSNRDSGEIDDEFLTLSPRPMPPSGLHTRSLSPAQSTFSGALAKRGGKSR